MSELVHLTIEDGLATITLDSPANRNALSRQLTTDLATQFDRAIADSHARIILLTATGPVFCSGADLKEQREANETGGKTGPAALAPILEAMWNAPKPVVGRINGAARAGGMGLVGACDIAIGVESASFAVNEVRIGVIPAIISVILLRKLADRDAMEIFLTGEVFNGTRASAMGLLNSAVHSDKLDSETERYIAMLKLGAPSALGGAKRLVREAGALAMREGFDAMAELSATYFASAEALEGMTAFAAKRPPAWAK